VKCLYPLQVFKRLVNEARLLSFEPSPGAASGAPERPFAGEDCSDDDDDDARNEYDDDLPGEHSDGKAAETSTGTWKWSRASERKAEVDAQLDRILKGVDEGVFQYPAEAGGASHIPETSWASDEAFIEAAKQDCLWFHDPVTGDMIPLTSCASHLLKCIRNNFFASKDFGSRYVSPAVFAYFWCTL
jgi:hypothetical protein